MVRSKFQGLLVAALASVVVCFQQKASLQSSTDDGSLGAVASLDEEGYQQVRASESTDEMKSFLLRLLKDSGVQMQETDNLVLDDFVQSVAQTTAFPSLESVKKVLLSPLGLLKAMQNAIVNAVTSIKSKFSGGQEKVASHKHGSGSTAHSPRVKGNHAANTTARKGVNPKATKAPRNAPASHSASPAAEVHHVASSKDAKPLTRNTRNPKKEGAPSVHVAAHADGSGPAATKVEHVAAVKKHVKLSAPAVTKPPAPVAAKEHVKPTVHAAQKSAHVTKPPAPAAAKEHQKPTMHAVQKSGHVRRPDRRPKAAAAMRELTNEDVAAIKPLDTAKFWNLFES